jgi:hypothetical protein
MEVILRHVPFLADNSLQRGYTPESESVANKAPPTGSMPYYNQSMPILSGIPSMAPPAETELTPDNTPGGEAAEDNNAGRKKVLT